MNKELKGVEEIIDYTGLSLDTLNDLRVHYGFPVRREENATTYWWQASSKELEQWLKGCGFKTWKEVNIADVRAFLLRERRKGPGPVFTGDMDQICNRLRIGLGTFVDILRHTDSPIRKIDEEGSNQYTVDLHRWEDFKEKKAKEGRRNPW